MRNIHDDESEHGNAIDNPHNFIGVDLRINNTEKTIHLYDLQSVKDVQPKCSIVGHDEADDKNDVDQDVEKVEIVPADVLEIQQSS